MNTESEEPNSAIANVHKSVNSGPAWSETELGILVQATLLFPEETADRWRQIADYVEEAIGCGPLSVEEVREKALSCSPQDLITAAITKLKSPSGGAPVSVTTTDPPTPFTTQSEGLTRFEEIHESVKNVAFRNSNAQLWEQKREKLRNVVRGRLEELKLAAKTEARIHKIVEAVLEKAGKEELDRLAASVQTAKSDDQIVNALKNSMVNSILESLSKLSDKFPASNLKRPLGNGNAVVDWSEAELVFLREALARFPPGCSERWSAIAAYVNEQMTQTEAGSNERGMKDVMVQSKQLVR